MADIHNPQSVHIPELDGLRGLAVLLVMVFHFSTDIEPHSFAGWALLELCSVGWIGVDLFFVLSGYLITGILLKTKGTPHFFLNFYARRTMRIFPLYYGVLFIIFILFPWLKIHPQHSQFTNEQAWFWLYGTNLLISLKGTSATISSSLILTHFWTLAVEEHFYLLWPAIVRLIDPRRLLPIGLILVIVCAAARATMSYGAEQPTISYCLTPFRVDSLAMGALIAAYLHSIRPTVVSIRRLAVGTITVTAPFLLALFFMRGWRLHPHDPLVQVIGYPLLAGMFAACIILAIVAKRDSLWRIVLQMRILTALGKYSYGIYIFHLLIPFKQYFPAEQLFRATGSGVIGALLYISILSGTSFLMAYISWHCYEIHFIRLKRFFEYRGKSTEPPSTVALEAVG